MQDMEERLGKLLEDEFSQYGFPLKLKQIQQLTVFRTELQRWNAHTNLTAISEDTEIIYRHFLDSICVLTHCPIQVGDSVVDIGTGAGFPGIVLKIYIPEIKLTLIEVSHKKVAFLRFLISQLGFDSSIKVCAERAEICSQDDQFVNSYDWVLTRYIASLDKSAKYCIPMLKPTGRWIAYKSKETRREIRQSENTLKEFGAEIKNVHNSNIAHLNRSYIIISRIDIGS